MALGGIKSLYRTELSGDNLDTIPIPMLNPNQETLRSTAGDWGPFTFVSFDIEATGLLHEDPEIVQLAAVFRDKEGEMHNFNSFAMPRRAFSEGATAVTGLSVEDNTLLRHDTAIPTVTLFKCLEDFIKFIKTCPHMPVLVAHNSFCYDAPLLSATLYEYGLFGNFTLALRGGGFGDSLLVARHVWGDLKRHNLNDLKATLLPDRIYTPHCAVGDSQALYDLMCLDQVKRHHILLNSELLTLPYGAYSRQLIQNIVKNRPSLDVMSGSVYVTQLNVVAGAGYSFVDLQTVVRKLGMAGLKELYEVELGLRKHDMVEMKMFVCIAEALLGVHNLTISEKPETKGQYNPRKEQAAVRERKHRYPSVN